MRRLLLFLSLAFAAAAASGGASAAEPTLKTVASGLVHPWGLAFLPDGRLLVTERDGRLRIVDGDGKLSAPVDGLPAVEAVGQGGLLDVALDPEFATTGLVYLSLRRAARRRQRHALARGRLVFDGDSGAARRRHGDLPPAAGAGERPCISARRIAFAPTATCSSRSANATSSRARAGARQPLRQGGADHAGRRGAGRQSRSSARTARCRKSGATATATRRGRRSTRRPGKLWTVEHGARGGDEINIARGRQELRLAGDHLRPRLLRRQDRRGHRQGRHGAAGLLLGPVDRAVRHGLLHRRPVPGVEGQPVRRRACRRAPARASMLDGDKVVGEEKLLADLGERIRDVRLGPDGALWLLTDSPDGRVMRYGVE